MTNTLTMPFAIGQQMWEPVYPPQRVRVPCPVCFGKLAVVVELGNGERVGVPCEGCGIGFVGPRGFVEEWRYEASARPFVIASVESMSSRSESDWVVRSEDGTTYNFANLCATEAEAIGKAREAAEREMERQCDTRQHKRGAELKRAPWSVRYHRKEIANLERKLAWHKAKIGQPPSVDARLTDSESGTPCGSATNLSLPKGE